MPVLLEAFAEQHSRHWLGFSESYKGEYQSIQTIPDAQQRAHREAIAARSLARGVTTCAGVMEGWIEDVEDTLREGLDGNDFRLIAHAGGALIKASQILIDTANQACEQAEAIGGSPIIDQARAIIATGVHRMQAPRSKIIKWERMANRRPPEIDPALIERGTEQIRQGHFMTPEQALEAIRSPSH
jgi:hypothetical protein